MSIPTNNDVEGWHRALKVGRPLPFFVLVSLLRKVATADLQVRLVGENNLQRNQRKTYARVQGKLFALWFKYETDQRAEDP